MSSRLIRYIAPMIALLISGCAAYPSLGNDWKSIKSRHRIRVVNLDMPSCSGAVSYALNYFRSHGHGIVVDDSAAATVICAAPLPFLYRLLIPVRVDNKQFGDAAWVTITSSERQNAYVMVHEMRHLLFHDKHGFDLPPLFLEPIA